MIEQVHEIVDTVMWQPVEVGFTQRILDSHVWFYVALMESGVLVALLLYVFRGFREYRIKKHRIKKTIKEDVAFQNIIKNSIYATEIYDELMEKCHPELFIGDDREKIADRLFLEINRNKTNYKRLCELKEQARRELKVNI